MSTQQPALNSGDLDLRQRAQPDTPITAGAWNALRSAILRAYAQADALATRPGAITVTVRERATDALAPAVDITRIQAQPEGESDSEIPVIRLGGRYFVGALDPGVYRVDVTPSEASGYAAQARPVCVRSGQTAEVTFFLAPPAPGRVNVPGLFGRSLQEALNRLAAAELHPGRVVDTHGKAVTVTRAGYLGAAFVATDPLHAASTVVGSEPGEDMEIDRGAAVSLVIAAQRVVPPVERVTADLNLSGELRLENLDPQVAQTPAERGLALHLFQGLIVRDPTEQAFMPGLATRWEVSDDGLTWRFDLRAGTSWAMLDPRAGVVAVEPLTAADVAFALLRSRNLGGEGAEQPHIAGAEAIDDQTVLVTLEALPEGISFVEWLAQPRAFPVPRSRVEALGSAWTEPDNLLCSGPYVLASFAEDAIVLRKNDMWPAAEGVQIEEVHFLRLDDEERALQACQSGALDSAVVPVNLLEAVQADPVLAGQLHTIDDGLTWLTRPWLERSYPADPAELPFAHIHTWRLDWHAKRQALRS